MISLRAHGFYDTLTWFRCPRWLYHAIKGLTSCAVAFGLVALAWALGSCALYVLLLARGWNSP